MMTGAVYEVLFLKGACLCVCVCVCVWGGVVCVCVCVSGGGGWLLFMNLNP